MTKNKKIVAIAAGVAAVLLIGSVLGSGRQDVADEPSPTVADTTTTVADTTTTVAETTTTVAETTTTVAETVPPTIPLSEVELLALRATFDVSQICPFYNDAIAAGVDEIDLINASIAEFESGYGQPLLPTSRAWIVDQLLSCSGR